MPVQYESIGIIKEHLHGDFEGPTFIFHTAWLHIVRNSCAFVAHSHLHNDSIVFSYSHYYLVLDRVIYDSYFLVFP